MNNLNWFIKEFPDYVKKMKSCSYNYDEENLNLHHMEDSVWTHTMMAYNYAINLKVNEYVKWAVLLHDVGRVLTRKVNKKSKKVTFGDFEGVSVYLSLKVLNKTTLTQEQKIRIIKIIAFQYEIIDYVKYLDPSKESILNKFRYEQQLINDLCMYVKCDLSGRIIADSKKKYYGFIDKRVKELRNNILKINQIRTNYKKSVYILVGPPCSGKSSWISKNFNNYYLISRDDCILKIGNDYDITDYDKAYDLMKENEQVSSEIDSLEMIMIDNAFLSNYENIIIDNPNLKEKFRDKWIKKFSSNYNINIVLFLTPLEILVKRDIIRTKNENKSIGVKVIINKLKTFSFPILSKRINKILYVL